LSYAIQNYYRPSTTLRLTYRRYHLWLLSNAPRLLMLFTQLSHKTKGVELGSTFLKHPSTFLSLFFSKGILKLFTKSALKWRPLVGSQFVKGLSYWAYRVNLNLIENESVVHVPKLTFSPTYFLNQTLLEKSYTNITLSSKYYRVVMMNFLYLSFRGWQVWRSQFKFTSSLIFVGKDLHLLKYFNTRIFKILSV